MINALGDGKRKVTLKPNQVDNMEFFKSGVWFYKHSLSPNRVLCEVIELKEQWLRYKVVNTDKEGHISIRDFNVIPYSETGNYNDSGEKNWIERFSYYRPAFDWVDLMKFNPPTQEPSKPKDNFNYVYTWTGTKWHYVAEIVTVDNTTNPKFTVVSVCLVGKPSKENSEHKKGFGEAVCVPGDVYNCQKGLKLARERAHRGFEFGTDGYWWEVSYSLNEIFVRRVAKLRVKIAIDKVLEDKLDWVKKQVNQFNGELQAYGITKKVSLV